MYINKYDIEFKILFDIIVLQVRAIFPKSQGSNIFGTYQFLGWIKFPKYCFRITNTYIHVFHYKPKLVNLFALYGVHLMLWIVCFLKIHIIFFKHNNTNIYYMSYIYYNSAHYRYNRNHSPFASSAKAFN